MRRKCSIYHFLLAALFASFLIFNTNPVSATSISSFSMSSNTVNIDVSPSSSGNDVNTGSQTATIETDCSSGYKIYVSMSSDSQDNKLHLNGQSSNNTSGTNAINSVSSNMSSMDTLTSNTWGVRPGEGNVNSPFVAVPTYSSISSTNQSANPTALISSTSAASSGTNHTITYGVNAGTSLIPGDYSANVLYTAVMNTSCYTSTILLVKDSHVSTVSGVTSGNSYNVGSSQTVTCTPDTGYSCAWYNGDTQVSTGPSYSFNVPGDNITLTAKSTINSYTLETVNGDPEHISSISEGGQVEYNSITSVSCTTVTGYYCYWYDEENDLQISDIDTWYFYMPAKNYRLTARADLVTRELKVIGGYIGESGTETTGSFTYGTEVTIRANPSVGYHFTDWSGWSTGVSGTIADIHSATTTYIIGDGYAEWTANQAANRYSVAFNGCSNTGGSMNNQSFTYGTAQNLTSNAFSKTGYSFDGWATDSCSGTKTYNNSASVSSLTATNGGVVNLYAKWSVRLYTLTVAKNSSTAVSSVSGGGSKTYGSSVSVTCSPNPGYHCGGWTSSNTSLVANSSNTSYTFTMPANDITLTANGYENTYLVYAHSNELNTYQFTDVGYTSSTIPGLSQVSSSLQKSGYILTGWALSSSAIDAAYSPNTPMKRIVDDAGMASTNGATIDIYPIWVETGSGSANWNYVSRMQDMTADICKSASPGSSKSLYDGRDQSYYTIQKLMDGRCWMTQNLRYIGTSSDPGSSIYDYGSFSVTTSTSQGSGTIQRTSSFSGATTATNALKEAYYPGNTNRGAYYSWGAANTVCPKGWHLPSKDEYIALSVAYGEEYSSISEYFSPYAAGDYDTDTWENTEQVELWSSTSAFDSDAYYLNMYSSGIIGMNNEYKSYGMPVRCVSNRADISGISYMQDITSSIINNTSTDSSVTLTDLRDNSTYAVRKMADGKVWMTQNLRYIGTFSDPGSSSYSSGSFSLSTSASQGSGTVSRTDSFSGASTASSNLKEAYYPGSTSRGAYYSWGAAGAVCPKGWQLPSKDEYNNLLTSYGGIDNANTAFYNAFSPYAAGDYDEDTWESESSAELWTSSVPSFDTDAYYFYVYNTYGHANNTEYKSYGMPVRCVSS